LKSIPASFSFLLILILAGILLCPVSGQINKKGRPDTLLRCSPKPYAKDNRVRMVFYNTENLFDTFDDSTTADEDFLPDGVMHWTYSRYKAKLDKVCKVITAAGGWKQPDIVGLCEIENDRVLQDLIYNSPLVKFEYRYIHKNSPDLRGIDVALLYNPATVRILEKDFIPVVLPDSTEKYTRDILYCKIMTPENDTLHLFINHWPSRSRGFLETEPFRIHAASILRMKIDSVLLSSPQRKIIVMGDFNDGPFDKSLLQIVRAKTDTGKLISGDIYNLAAGYEMRNPVGSHKFRGQWNMLDQIIVSENLLNRHTGLTTGRDCFSVFAPPFLLTEDTVYMGAQPFRTYRGPVYLGGFSDHLPVMVDLFY
jgi:endonuclease/exonuclease/phosphatase family metal-dependent hydrolase